MSCIHGDYSLLKTDIYFIHVSLQMELTVSETNKGKQSLLYDDYTFRVDAVLKNQEISWSVHIQKILVNVDYGQTQTVKA